MVPGWASAESAQQGPAAAKVRVPAGVTAGIAVFDRAQKRFLHRADATKRFRSASLVKLLIALDHLWELGPDFAVAPGDREKLDVMLRSSDDAAASELWARNGRGAVVERMANRLRLRHTVPPPPERTGWGSTGVSAEDLVRVYRHVLDAAPAPVRALVMGNLSAATTCGTDGFDQSFGIRSAFRDPSAVKQGWVNFGDAPRHRCTPAPAPPPSTGTATAPATAPATDPTPATPPAGPTGPARVAAEPIDYASGALHTTGTVGSHHRAIVVVLTTHEPGTSFAQAGFALTNLVRSLPVPGAAPGPALPRPEGGRWFGTWSSGVPVRASTTNSSPRVATVPASQEVRVSCQATGEEVVSGTTRNPWWTYVPDLGGYMSNIYFEYPDDQLPGVPVCT